MSARAGVETDLCHDNPGIIGGGLLADDFVLLPSSPGATTGLPVLRWGAVGGRALEASDRRWLKVCGQIQEIPSPDSGARLDPHVRDVHGRRVARLSGSVHPESVRRAIEPGRPQGRRGSL